MATETVLLSTAYRWTCPRCGEANYSDPTPVEFTRGELATIQCRLSAVSHETVSLPEGGMFVVAPGEVTCGGCQMEFTTSDGSDA